MRLKLTILLLFISSLGYGQVNYTQVGNTLQQKDTTIAGITNAKAYRTIKGSTGNAYFPERREVLNMNWAISKVTGLQDSLTNKYSKSDANTSFINNSTSSQTANFNIAGLGRLDSLQINDWEDVVPNRRFEISVDTLPGYTSHIGGKWGGLFIKYWKPMSGSPLSYFANIGTLGVNAVGGYGPGAGNPNHAQIGTGNRANIKQWMGFFLHGRYGVMELSDIPKLGGYSEGANTQTIFYRDTLLGQTHFGNQYQGTGLQGPTVFHTIGKYASDLTDSIDVNSLALINRGYADSRYLNLSDTANLVHKTGTETIAGAKTFSSFPIFSSGTSGRIPYFTTGGQITDDADLTFDGTNLSIANAPTTGNHVVNKTYADANYIRNQIASVQSADLWISGQGKFGSFTIDGGNMGVDASNIDLYSDAQINLSATTGVEIVVPPTTSAGSYDILTRNSSTGIIEKAPSSTYLTPGAAASTYLPLTGGTLSGALNTQDIIPTAHNSYSLGSSGNRWRNIYVSKDAFFGQTFTLASSPAASVSGHEILTRNTSSGLIEKLDSGTFLTATNPTTNSDIEVTDNTKGIILKSPDGTRYRITVANGGTLTITAL